MGLIIKNKLQQLMKGYPTVSDKYNVKGGILEGTTDIHFGELVQYGTNRGYYKAITTTITGINKIAGICLATNVKLNDVWPADPQGPKVKVGEAFNLLLDGYCAVELDADALTHLAEITENAQVYVLLTNGHLCTASTAGATALTGYKFTGTYDIVEGKVLAEVRVCC